MELDYTALGNRIKVLRKKRKIKQEKLAELAGVSIPHISNIENGKTKVSLTTVVSIANALETGVDMLICDNLTSVKDPYTSILVENSKSYSNDEIRLVLAVSNELVKSYRKEKDSIKKTYKDQI